MELNELYIAPDAEILSFRAAERLAWGELEGDRISNDPGIGGGTDGEDEF